MKDTVNMPPLLAQIILLALQCSECN